MTDVWRVSRPDHILSESEIANKFDTTMTCFREFPRLQTHRQAHAARGEVGCPWNCDAKGNRDGT